MLHRAQEIIHQLQNSKRFGEIIHQLEAHNTPGAIRIIQEIGHLEYAYAEIVANQLAQDILASHLSAKEALYENPNALRILIRSDNKAEAIELYHDQTGVSWQEAKNAIDRLEIELQKESATLAEQRQEGPDPALLFFLTKAGHRDTATTYYSTSASVDLAEAEAAIDRLQQEIATGNAVLPESGKRPFDPAAIHLLLRSGHKLIAIRYYRDCTEVSMTEAVQAVESMSLKGES